MFIRDISNLSPSNTFAHPIFPLSSTRKPLIFFLFCDAPNKSATVKSIEVFFLFIVKVPFLGNYYKISVRYYSYIFVFLRAVSTIQRMANRP